VFLVNRHSIIPQPAVFIIFSYEREEFKSWDGITRDFGETYSFLLQDEA
jgi:hypothetical protein